MLSSCVRLSVRLSQALYQRAKRRITKQRVHEKRRRVKRRLPAGRGRDTTGAWADGRCGFEIRPDVAAKRGRPYGRWGTTTADYRPTSTSPVYCQTDQHHRSSLVTSQHHRSTVVTT